MRQTLERVEARLSSILPGRAGAPVTFEAGFYFPLITSPLWYTAGYNVGL